MGAVEMKVLKLKSQKEVHKEQNERLENDKRKAYEKIAELKRGSKKKKIKV